jgi:two-component system cell cycle sensor histidine kinase/response regulator CckA
MATARVLVVDDEPLVLSVVSKALATRGYEIHAASSPGQALEAVERLPCFDLVVSDVIMPEMCGPELVRRIERICPEVGVVLMSGNLRAEGIPERAVFLGKPFLLTDLYATVDKALTRCRKGSYGDGGNGAEAGNQELSRSQFLKGSR